MVTDASGAQRLPEWIPAADDLVSRWTATVSETGPGAFGDAETRAFIVAALDAVLRQHTFASAAEGLRTLSAALPHALPWMTRSAVHVSGAIAAVVPAAIVPVSRRAVRGLVSDVVSDADPGQLSTLLTTLRGTGARVMVSPVTDLPAGDAEARGRCDILTALLADPQIDAVRVRARGVVGHRSSWAFDDTVDEIVVALTRAHAGTSTRLVLAIDAVADLEITLAVLQRLTPEAGALGVALPLALPDAVAALPVILRAARTRARAGGGLLQIILDSGRRFPGELTEAAHHGWEPAALDDPVEVAASLLRALEQATAEPTVRVSVTDHDLPRLALARAWADAHGCTVDLEAAWHDEKVRAALAETSTGLRLSVPVAERGVDDAALAHTVCRLIDERAVDAPVPEDLFARAAASAGREAPETHRSPDRTRAGEQRPDTRIVREPSTGDDGLTQEVIGIARAQANAETSPIAPEAAEILFGGAPLVETAIFQDKEDAAPARGIGGFRAAADTDPETPANREWVRAVLGRVPEASSHIERAVDAVSPRDRVRAVARAADEWASTPAVERAAVLRRVAAEWDIARAGLIEAGSAVELPADVDADVTAAVDAAVYAASCAGELDATAGARFVPATVTVVAAGEVAATAILAEGLASALAAGSGVVVRPAERSHAVADLLRSAAVSAGIAPDLVTVVGADEDGLWDVDEVDQLIATGDGTLARDVAQRRPDIAVHARIDTSAVAIVTASADLTAAAEHIISAGFARAGRAAESTNVVIVLGSAGRSRAFAARLADIAGTWRPGFGEDPRALIGPFPADDLTEAALGEPDPGERWLIAPALNPDGLRGGGIRIGTELGARFTRERPEAPLISVLAATTLSEAIAWQNDDGRGAHATLYTRDERDLALWLHEVQAGTLSVNTAARGMRAQRDPMPVWGEASRGTAAAAGGPNRLVTLGTWHASQGAHGSSTLHLRGLDSRISALIEAAQPELDYVGYERVRRGALSDAVAWDREFGRVKDVTGLPGERNLLRYRRIPVSVRAGADADLADILRVVTAAVRVHAAVTLSLAGGLPGALRHALGEAGITVFVETADEWTQRVLGAQVRRVRVIGDAARADAAALRTIPDIAVYDDDVTAAGRLELLPFLREQAITIAAAREGDPDRWSEAVI